MAPVFADNYEHESILGKTIFDYADMFKVRVPTACGRTGECHECIIEIKDGFDALNSPTLSEFFLQDNYRLACQATLTDIKTRIEFATLRRQPKILTKSKNRIIANNPRVTKSGNNVLLADGILDEYKGNILGLAADIGTTTIVLSLIDLETSETLITSSFENPQKFGGSDVMNRISYDGSKNQGELKNVLISSLNYEIGEMSKKISVHRRRIYDAVLVGNTTMRDILFGIDVQPIGQRPYKSNTQIEFEKGLRKTTSLDISAKEIGLRIFPKARIYSGPLISSHVGTDVSADLIAISIDESESNIMLVDIGTNTEVIIGNKHKMVATSCPAGPAFEGGQITYGMPGYEGAIEKVRLTNGQVEITTIGDAPAIGICGSGLVDLLAELKNMRLINDLGVFHDGINEFLLENNSRVSLSKSDISALAQAKSANYCGQYIALRHFQAPVDKLYLAGGFANYIDTKNAKDIGFIANFPASKIEKSGNAALEGACILLRSVDMREKLESLVHNIEHIELETTPDFFDIFVEGCMFKPMLNPVIYDNKKECL
jgi:uncharacterized 2Fe-2S/4Fe-4S cluster protein (DUF4445 family)